MTGCRDFVSDLLISPKKPDITYDPFPYFYIDDYLPKDLYAALHEEFPSMTFFDGRNNVDRANRLRKMALNPRGERYAEFLASSPSWTKVIDALRSDAFLKDVEGLLRPALVQARGVAGRRGWWNHTSASRRVPIVERPVEFSCEFSRLSRGAFLYPHTDKPEKLVSFLLYFPEPDWEQRYGGATDLYRVKQAKHDRNWSGRAVTFDAVDTVFRSEFRSNRLMVFVKSRNSYHGVSPVTPPDGVARKSFNFNVIVPREQWGGIGKRLVDSYRWRTEEWRFREFTDVNEHA